LRIIALDTKAKIITISSGKGGVGKTCTSVNLAILLAQKGYKVCLFDADANLANVNIMLKLTPEYTLEHVISGQKTLNEIILHKAGIQIVPGASGTTDFINLGAEQQQRLLDAMQYLKSICDYLIIDNPAGISENVLSYIKFSDYGILVITPEPTSLTDAFALTRVLQKRGNQKKLNIIINNVSTKEYAEKIFKRFSDAVEKHIGYQLNYLGSVVSDELIEKSICLQNPVVLQYPTARSVKNYSELSTKITYLQKQSLLDNPTHSVQQPPLRKQPDFSVNATSLNENNKPTIAQPLSAEKLKIEIINIINDKNNEKTKLKEMVQQINIAYLKRFGDYIIDLSQILHDAMKMDRLSKTTVQNLIMTLHSLYQDQYGVPFEVKKTSITTDPEENNNVKQETIEHLIKLLQQESFSKLNTSSQSNNVAIGQQGPKLVSPASVQISDTNQELLDSIRYASLVDN